MHNRQSQQKQHAGIHLRTGGQPPRLEMPEGEKAEPNIAIRLRSQIWPSPKLLRDQKQHFELNAVDIREEIKWLSHIPEGQLPMFVVRPEWDEKTLVDQVTRAC